MSSGRLPEFTYLRPTTVKEVCALLNEHRPEAKVLAGGTELLIRMKQRLSAPQYLISLNGISDLDYIDYDEDSGLALGPLTTIQSLTDSPVIKHKYAVLAQAAHQTSTLPLHHVSTVGGNICIDTRCIYYTQSSDWREVRPACFKRGGDVCHAVKGGKHCHAVYQSDLAPALMALEAKIRISRTDGEKFVPISEFFTGVGDKPNILEPDEIITKIQLPYSGNLVGSCQKLRIREAIDFPLASVAVVLDVNEAKICRKARVILGAVGSAPVEASGAEEVLQGKRVDDRVIEEAAEEAFKTAHPVANLGIDAVYRRKMIPVLFRRAIKQALGRQGE